MLNYVNVIQVLKRSLLWDLKILIKVSNLKYTGVPLDEKKGFCFCGVLQGKKLKINLQEHTVSIKE